MNKVKNSLKYLGTQFNRLREQEWFSYSLDLLVTGLAIGIGLFPIRTRYSLAQGIGIAVIIAIGQGYIKYLVELVKDIKRTKGK